MAAIDEAYSSLTWNALSLAERVKRYRLLASEAFVLATETEDSVARAGYLSLASGWHDLALELEHSRGLLDDSNRRSLDAAQQLSVRDLH